jgi:hypothetical protein
MTIKIKKGTQESPFFILTGRALFTLSEPPQNHDFIELTYLSQEGIFLKCAPLYRKGRTIRQITKETGIPKSTVRDALKNGGVNLRPSAREPKSRSFMARRPGIGIPPYGFSWHQGHLVVNPQEIETLRLIIKLWQEELSPAAIAARLNGHGNMPRRSSKWDHSAIKKLIVRYQTNPKQFEEVFSWDSKKLFSPLPC